MEAAKVPTPAVRMAFISGVGWPGSWGAQDESRIPVIINRINIRRAMYIFYL
jgi:hypothetical protein